MKVTKSQLKQIIKEEMEQVTQEQERKRLDEIAGIPPHYIDILMSEMQNFMQWYQQHPEIPEAAFATAIATLGVAAAGGVTGYLAALQQRAKKEARRIEKKKRIEKRKEKEIKRRKEVRKKATPEWKSAETEVSALGNVGSQQPSTVQPRRPQRQPVKEKQQ